MSDRPAMHDDATHWSLLQRAADNCAPRGLDQYFELRRLLVNGDVERRQEFVRRFSKYYRLTRGGLSQAFKDRFFELLFAFELPGDGQDPYVPLLTELYEIPRQKGDRALQASFVSKLVAIHDESRPIYDGHVSRFFGVSPPSLGSIEFRAAGFVANLSYVAGRYRTFIADSRFDQLVAPLRERNSDLRTCHPVRLCDLLVWTVGAQKLA